MNDLVIFANRLISVPWLYALALLAALLAGWVASLFFRTTRFKRAVFIGVGVAVCLALGVGAALLKQWWCCSHPWGPPLEYDRLAPGALPADYTTYWGKVAVAFAAGLGVVALAIAGLLGACVALLARIDRAAQDLLGSRSGARGRAKTAPLFHHWV